MPRYPRQVRRGMLALAAAVPAACLLVTLFYRSTVQRDFPSPAPKDTLEAAGAAELQAFEQQLLRDSLRRAQARSHAAYAEGQADARKAAAAAQPFPFDPNTADSATLLRLGLRPWQAHNCRQYVRKGGRWRSPEHFSRLYGLSREDFERLRPYIAIARDSTSLLREAGRAEREARQAAWERRRDSLRALSPEKLPAGSVVDLNRADTLLLRRIPQIGEWRAKQIVEYRERLGGFVAASQLREIEGMPAGVEEWFAVEKGFTPRRINVNTATFQQLVRHPYLSYGQVKAIMQHRRTHGRLRSWKDVGLSPEFSDKDFQRLESYFCF
ncbi:MAG: helix-hairpin-helix domain-containing protein [Alloprevotella sp.]|nr:helix-hairpin-helix domain-containing protein [Alloprevotella sp.]